MAERFPNLQVSEQDDKGKRKGSARPAPLQSCEGL